MISRIGPLLAVSLILAACEATRMPGDAENAGEAACVEAVDTQTGNRRAEVMASETSSTGVRVLVVDADGRTWTCRATNSGVVEDVSLS